MELASKIISRRNVHSEKVVPHYHNLNINSKSTTLALGRKKEIRSMFHSIEKWNPETETWSILETQLDEKLVHFELEVPLDKTNETLRGTGLQ